MPNSVAVRDFNGDMNQDLVIANTVSNTFSFWAGSGDGTFRDLNVYDAGVLPYSVAAGDFDGDGVLDVAIASSGTNSVLVFLGGGDGAFGKPIGFRVCTTRDFVVAAGFND